MKAGKMILIFLAAVLIIRIIPGREIRHLNHILMELILRRVYRIITGRIERNRIAGAVTGAVISYYRFLERCYRHNYFKAHPGEEP